MSEWYEKDVMVQLGMGLERLDKASGWPNRRLVRSIILHGIIREMVEDRSDTDV